MATGPTPSQITVKTTGSTPTLSTHGRSSSPRGNNTEDKNEQQTEQVDQPKSPQVLQGFSSLGGDFAQLRQRKTQALLLLEARKKKKNNNNNHKEATPLAQQQRSSADHNAGPTGGPTICSNGSPDAPKGRLLPPLLASERPKMTTSPFSGTDSTQSTAHQRQSHRLFAASLSLSTSIVDFQFPYNTRILLHKPLERWDGLAAFPVGSGPPVRMKGGDGWE